MIRKAGTFLISVCFLVLTCSDGGNDQIPDLNLLSNLSLPGRLTDVWGYLDELTGREYALVGFNLANGENSSGIYIVDATDPANPILASTITSVPGFDVKVWQNYMYTVNGSGTGEGGIVDLTDPAMPARVGSFPSSHNLFISENGFMYLEFPGLRIYDLNPDPLNPQLVWSTEDNDGHDASIIGNRLYDFHGRSGTNLYDISDPTAPQFINSITAPFIQYHHSGWATPDQQFVFICDEFAREPNPDITAWDISDPANPAFVGEVRDSTAIAHNLYLVGNLAYVSYYTAGFRIYDVTNPAEIRQLAGYDTSPSSGDAFDGAFGCYPFTRSGNIYVSDMGRGLFIFSYNADAGAGSDKIIAP